MNSGFRFGGSRASERRSNATASDARQKAGQAQGEVAEMRGEIERLMMITESLWIFMKKEHGYTDEALIAEITRIDLRDGALDGRVTTTAAPKKCASCGRTLARRRPTCLFCGTFDTPDPFER